MKTEIKRKFTGKLNIEIFNSKGEKISKDCQHFYDRMLRAYLQGKEFFNFGFETQNFKRVPIRHKVEYSLT